MKLFIFIILFLNNILAYSDPIKVGVLKGVPPFADVSDTSQGSYFYGFSIDIMNSICKHINQKCVYTAVEMSTQLSILDQGSIDVLLLAIPYAGGAQDQYLHSLPYVVSKVQFVTLKATALNSLSDIKNQKIGVMKSTYYNLLEQSSYKKDNNIVAFNTITDLIAALTNNNVDVIILNNAIADYYINNNIYNFKTVGGDIALGEGYGILALPDKKELINQINKAILSMQVDGSYIAIYNKYYDPN